MSTPPAHHYQEHQKQRFVLLRMDTLPTSNKAIYDYYQEAGATFVTTKRNRAAAASTRKVEGFDSSLRYRVIRESDDQSHCQQQDHRDCSCAVAQHEIDEREEEEQTNCLQMWGDNHRPSSSSLLADPVSRQEQLWMMYSSKNKGCSRSKVLPPPPDYSYYWNSDSNNKSPLTRFSLFQGGVGFWLEQDYAAPAIETRDETSGCGPPALVDLRHASIMRSCGSGSSEWTLVSEGGGCEVPATCSSLLPTPFAPQYEQEQDTCCTDSISSSTEDESPSMFSTSHYCFEEHNDPNKTRIRYTSIDDEIPRFLFEKEQSKQLALHQLHTDVSETLEQPEEDSPLLRLLSTDDEEEEEEEEVTATVSEHRMALAATARNVIQELDAIFG
ncbi:hypothetical protein ACA910_004339 [Epithemia clementina (nom. ined.)]